MNTNRDAVKMKQTRVMILQSINRLNPGGVLIRMLYRSMVGFYENYSLSLLDKDLWYLKKKGYVEYVDDKLGREDIFEEKVIGLTAEGKEIADRTQTDSALEI